MALRKLSSVCLSLLLLGEIRVVPAERLPAAAGPFSIGNAEIVWRAATNHLPASLWVYKEIPAEFSPQMISNIMALGEFRKTDQKKVPVYYPIREKSLLHFESKDKTRRLDLVPAFGWIDYSDSKAIVSTKRDGPVEGIPTLDHAVELAVKYAAQMGIERFELATKQKSSELKTRFTAGHRRWDDKELDKTVLETNMVGVNLIRKLDGLDFAGGWGSGGLWIDFGNRAKVALLKMSWRNLQRHKSYPVASRQTMMEQIKRGEASMVGPPINPADLKKVVIKAITPFYWAGIGYNPHALVYPFAVLEAHVSLGQTNVALELNCPILIED